MSKRVTERIKAREAKLQQPQPVSNAVEPAGDNYSSGVRFDVEKPKATAKPKATKKK